jgi:ATP-binding cassette subfamily B protein
VPQDVFLFSESIGQNIAFGDALETITGEQIHLAAKQADIYDNIIEFPKGFDTHIGERGITLSGGQKQRISIARAIIRDPQILIFDDCLSAVDTETEEKILAHLKDLMEGKTTVIISHRVSSVKHADQIIVLDDGGIIERGEHQELLDLNGVYAELYQKQLLEEDQRKTA